MVLSLKVQPVLVLSAGRCLQVVSVLPHRGWRAVQAPAGRGRGAGKAAAGRGGASGPLRRGGDIATW